MQAILENYPELVAIVILIAGLICARLTRRGVDVVMSLLDERLSRYSVSGRGVVSPQVIRFAKTFSFWLVVAVSVVIVLPLLDIAEVTLVVDDLFAFLGRLLIGLTIIGLGHFLGLLARGVLDRFTEGVDGYDLTGRLVHGAIVAVAVLMALAQLEIDTSFITQLLLIVVAITVGGLALAFALGARGHVANLLAHGDLRRFSVGERIVIGETEGTIVEIHATGVDLETPRGIASIPAAHFSRASVLRVVNDHADD